jgi:thiol-disulfide isomerase/thioredoxin
MSRSLATTFTFAAVLALITMAAFNTSVGADPADASAITVQFANWEQTLKIVAGHKGKVVVLDAWSTSCQPCKEEFPNLVKLHKKHGKSGLACLSLACDYSGVKDKPPEYYKERILKFLTKQGATFQNLIATVPSDELYDQMQLTSIPAVYVFGRDGKLAKRFDNEKAENEEDNFTYKDVTKLVEELLAKK